MVNTALQYTVGVVPVRVAAGTSEKEILADAFKAITRTSTSFLDHSASARRILWWHHVLFRQPVTVVLQAAERKPTQQFADLDSSARALTYDYGARVLIDASNNSLPDAATATKREDVLEVEPMQRKLLEALPKLQPLHVALKSANLADVVWMCMGGNPADYESLATKWTRQPSDLEHVVALFVQNLIGRANDNISSAVANNERLQGLYDMFRESSEVPSRSRNAQAPAAARPAIRRHRPSLASPCVDLPSGFRVLGFVGVRNHPALPAARRRTVSTRRRKQPRPFRRAWSAHPRRRARRLERERRARPYAILRSCMTSVTTP